MASNQQTRPEIGAVVRDVATGDVGVVMGAIAGRVQLRPLIGGMEWDAQPSNVQALRAREELSARLAARNGASEWGH